MVRNSQKKKSLKETQLSPHEMEKMVCEDLNSELEYFESDYSYSS